MGTGTFSVCLPSLHTLLGSWSLGAIMSSTRSFFSLLSSKSRNGIKIRGQEESGGYDNPNRQQDGSKERIHVITAVDVGYASSGKSSKGGKVTRKTTSQENYLVSTTETYATRDMHQHQHDMV